VRAPLQRERPDGRLSVGQMQPRHTFLWKYVSCRAKQLGVIERADMEIRESGQADRFAS
jgi:hypothetical protein